MSPLQQAYNAEAMGETATLPRAVDVAAESRNPDGTPKAGLLSLTVPYGEGQQLQVQIRVTGERLKRAHIARVRKYLELAEDDLTDDGGSAS